MAQWAVPLADVTIEEEDLQAVVATYRSGWLSMGPRTSEFEEAFAAYVGTRHAVAVSSGTAGLHLMCLAAGLGADDEVILPSMTFVATANAVRYAGARPVFADVAGLLEPWLSAARCAEAITPRTRAILAVGYGGHPGELAALEELAARNGLMLLHDAAHALGTELSGRPVATRGLASAFSFFSNKNLAIGEGGMVTTDDDDLAVRLRLLRSHGMTSLSWDRHRGHATEYDVVALGFNYRMDEPRAALGIARLSRLTEENARRAGIDARYREELDGVVGCALAPRPGMRSAYHLFTIVLEPGADRVAFRRQLADAGIQTSVHYPPVHGFSIHRDGAPALPVTEEYARRTVTLPMFAHMSAAQQSQVIAAVRQAVPAQRATVN
jgi:dTDP-4-amino-4,6-dideoxygalactose transaminase